MIRQTVRVTPEAEIVCVDCGGRCYLTSYPPEDGLWFPGDIVTYKCRDCLDRWDLVLPEEDNDFDRWADLLTVLNLVMAPGGVVVTESARIQSRESR